MAEPEFWGKLFGISIGMLMGWLLVILSVLIYTHNFPPFWLAYPIPPLFLVIGLSMLMAVIKKEM